MTAQDAEKVCDEIGEIIKIANSKKHEFVRDLRLGRARCLVETRSGRRATLYGANW
jgi:flagellar biosynthesis/type III secretory pathway protein FliH